LRGDKELNLFDKDGGKIRGNLASGEEGETKGVKKEEKETLQCQKIPRGGQGEPFRYRENSC